MGNAIAPARSGFQLGSPPWNRCRPIVKSQFSFPTSQVTFRICNQAIRQRALRLTLTFEDP
jgi:hypothetical protein